MPTTSEAPSSSPSSVADSLPQLRLPLKHTDHSSHPRLFSLAAGGFLPFSSLETSSSSPEPHIWGPWSSFFFFPLYFIHSYRSQEHLYTDSSDCPYSPSALGCPPSCLTQAERLPSPRPPVGFGHLMACDPQELTHLVPWFLFLF